MHSNRGLMSRGSGSMSSHGRSRQLTVLSCNACRSPIEAITYITGCDCLLCESCAHGHFSTHDFCPICRKKLSEDDLMEVIVIPPSPNIESTKSSCLQAIFTKQQNTCKALSHQEACTQLMRQYEELRRGTRFLFKQILTDVNTHGQEAGTSEQGRKRLEEENADLKQAMASMELQYQKKVTELENRVQVMANTIKKNEKRIQKLQEAFADANSKRPLSTGSRSSGGGKRGPGHHRSPTNGFHYNSMSQPYERTIHRSVSTDIPNIILAPMQPMQQPGFRPGTASSTTTYGSAGPHGHHSNVFRQRSSNSRPSSSGSHGFYIRESGGSQVRALYKTNSFGTR